MEKIDPVQVRMLQQLVVGSGLDENHAFRYFRVAKIVNGLDSKNILNIGCGKGFLERLVTNYEHITSLDISEHELEIARANNKGKKNTEFIATDLFQFGRGEKYDLVIASEVLEHLENDSLFFVKIRELISTGGLLLLTVPNRLRLKNIILNLLGRKIEYMAADHRREYSLDEIRTLLQRYGFKIIRINGAYFRLPLEYTLRRYGPFRPDSSFRFILENFFYTNFIDYDVYYIILSRV